MPDVWAPDFEQRIDGIAARMCAPHKDDPYLLGYFIGNEPAWPTRESALADMIHPGVQNPHCNPPYLMKAC